MKFYENMEPVKRKAMVLKAVANSVALEGMNEAAEACMNDFFKIQRGKVQSTTYDTRRSNTPTRRE